jgi:hypothetical protein
VRQSFFEFANDGAKGFYSVMYAPSCVKVSMLRGSGGKVGSESHLRLHHLVSWESAVPQIIEETFKKGGARAEDAGARGAGDEAVVASNG